MKKTVLVTAIGTAASTTIVNQLKKNGEYYVIGSDINSKNRIVTSKDVDEFYTFPSSVSDLDQYIDFVYAFCKEHRVDYYFATIDEEVANLACNRDRFEEAGIHLCIPNSDLVRICHYKDRFFDWIETNFPEIACKRYLSFSEIDRYPVFIKPIEGRASIGCLKIDSKEKADQLIKSGIHEKDYVIQEFLDGDIVTVDLIRSALTKNKYMIQRNEHLRNSSGCGIAVEIIENEKLSTICDELMEKLDLNGVVNAEFFMKNGEFRIIEINPRFSAGSSFSCMAGCDIINDAIKIANKEDCVIGKAEIGAHFAKRYETYRLD